MTFPRPGAVHKLETYRSFSNTSFGVAGSVPKRQSKVGWSNNHPASRSISHACLRQPAQVHYIGRLLSMFEQIKSWKMLTLVTRKAASSKFFPSRPWLVHARGVIKLMLLPVDCCMNAPVSFSCFKFVDEWVHQTATVRVPRSDLLPARAW